MSHSTTATQHSAVDFLNPNQRRVLNETELAQRWGISAKTLQRWRLEGTGPRYLKLSKRVSYPFESILEFEHRSMHISTSERVHCGD